MELSKIKNSKAIVLDLDGVITHTMELHKQAWKMMFDKFLEGYKSQQAFTDQDYFDYVDGKPRYENVKCFLKSRNISLDEGDERNDENNETVFGLGKRKNRFFMLLLKTKGAKVYHDTVAFINKCKEEGKKLVVVSSSKNCRAVLEQAGLNSLFDAIVDGVDAKKRNLKGKPAPDIFIEATKIINVNPSDAVVFEDAIAGIEAGKNANFGFIVAVNRNNDASNMKKAGANLVINSLSDLS